MGLFKQFKEKINNLWVDIYPYTKVEAVSDSNNRSLQSLLDAKAELDDTVVSGGKGWSSYNITNKMQSKVLDAESGNFASFDTSGQTRDSGYHFGPDEGSGSAAGYITRSDLKTVNGYELVGSGDIIVHNVIFEISPSDIHAIVQRVITK